MKYWPKIATVEEAISRKGAYHGYTAGIGFKFWLSHSGMFCGQIGAGKTYFCPDLSETMSKVFNDLKRAGVK